MSPSFLKVSGTKLVDGQGHEVILRGAGLGGWMNMENFISGSAKINGYTCNNVHVLEKVILDVNFRFVRRWRES